jgi:hypothetical protein
VRPEAWGDDPDAGKEIPELFPVLKKYG